MSEINQPDSVYAAGQQLPERKHRESEKRNPYESSAKKAQNPTREPGEVASILGISPEAINNEIQHAVSDLLNQLDWLRRHLDEVTHRKNYLEEIADVHSRADIINRHALLRELNRRMEHAVRVGLTGKAALVHIPGLDDIRLQYGLSVADDLLQQICAMILSRLRAGDVAGLISDQDIVLALPLKDEAEAQVLVGNICNEIRALDFAVNETYFSFELFYSVCDYTKYKQAAEVIRNLDKQLLESLGDSDGEE